MNVFHHLISGLNEAESMTGGDRDLVEPMVAGLFLGLLFGAEWHAKYIELNNNPDPWLLNGNDNWLRTNPIPSDVRRFIYAHRITRLADALLTVSLSKKVARAEGLRQRILRRLDTRAWFVESEIASMLVYNGCAVDVVEESGLRGQDFDILATTNTQKIAVEVTTIEEAPLTYKAILNKLQEKRDQVPKDLPAILYLHIPVSWMKDRLSARIAFSESVNDFITRSKRYNLIVLVFEEVRPLWGGAMPNLAMVAAYHNQPRYPIHDSSFFTLKTDKNNEFRFANSLLDHLMFMRTHGKAPLSGM